MSAMSYQTFFSISEEISPRGEKKTRDTTINRDGGRCHLNSRFNDREDIDPGARLSHRRPALRIQRLGIK